MPEQKPPQPQVTEREPEIHVIPDEFYGAAARARIPKARPAAAQPGAPVPAGPAAAPPAKQSKAWLLIPIVAILILGAMGAAAWYFLQKKAQAPAAPAPLVTLPTETGAPAEQQPAAPVEQPAPQPAEQPQTATSTPSAEVQPASSATTTSAAGVESAPDSDNDGLTDVEEQLYGTDPKSADSDGDGYSDSVELINLYNPAGFKPTRLIDSGLVKTYSTTEGGYQIYYPTPWAVDEKGGGEVVFNNPQNEPVAVSIEDNPGDQSILDWYLSRNPDASPAEVQHFYTKSGLEGVKSADGLTSYIAGGKKVFVIAYVPGLQQAYFRSTFVMMVNSFVLKP